MPNLDQVFLFFWGPYISKYFGQWNELCMWSAILLTSIAFQNTSTSIRISAIVPYNKDLSLTTYIMSKQCSKILRLQVHSTPSVLVTKIQYKVPGLGVT